MWLCQSVDPFTCWWESFRSLLVFELFQRKLQWRLLLSFYEHTFSVILGEYSGEESLDYLVVGCLSIFKTANRGGCAIYTTNLSHTPINTSFAIICIHPLSTVRMLIFKVSQLQRYTSGSAWLTRIFAYSNYLKVLPRDL